MLCLRSQGGSRPPELILVSYVHSFSTSIIYILDYMCSKARSREKSNHNGRRSHNSVVLSLCWILPPAPAAVRRDELTGESVDSLQPTLGVTINLISLIDGILRKICQALPPMTFSAHLHVSTVRLSATLVTSC